jgi:hypothetical protein
MADRCPKCEEPRSNVRQNRAVETINNPRICASLRTRIE